MDLTSIKSAKCSHPSERRWQCYPHGWRCDDCLRYFFGLASDPIPQTIPPEWKGYGEIHRRRKAQVAADMLAKGQTPPTITR